MLSPAQRALSAWFQQSGWTTYHQERWLFRQYGVLVIVYLTDAQAVAALARLRREAA